MDKLRNSTHEALRPSQALFPETEPRRNEAAGIFQECLSSVKLALTDQLLKVNSALKLIFSVIEDQSSGGHQSSK